MRRVAAVITGVILFWGGAVAHADSTGPIVEFQTSLGNIYVQLLQNDAPKTVANFLSYMNNGVYNGSFFHRSVPGSCTSSCFVIQGGGYSYTNNSLHTITPLAPVPNEFKDSNVRGTLAMALTAQSNGAINAGSATDQFFFNLSDANAPQLDQQGSSSETECAPQASPAVTTNCWRPGYTVFGKVLGATGLSVMDSIAGEPVTDLDSTFGETSGTTIFQDVPVLNFSNGTFTSGSFSPSDLIDIESITTIDSTTPPTVTVAIPTEGEQFDQHQVTLADFTCDDGKGAGIATCTGPAKIDTSYLGAHAFTITATDYAGLTTTKTIHYIVDPDPPPPNEQHAPAFTFPKSTQIKSNGAVTVTMRCGAPGGCHGKLSLAAGKRRTVIGSIALSMYNGQTKKLRFELSKSGRKMLRSGKGRLVVWMTVRLASHRPDTLRVTLKT